MQFYEKLFALEAELSDLCPAERAGTGELVEDTNAKV